MRRHKWPARERAAVLHAWHTGCTAAQLCQAYGISRATLYLWKRTYTGMSAEAIEQWDALAREHAQLRRQLASAQADRALLQAVLQTLKLTLEHKHALVWWARTQRLGSVTRACALLRLPRAQFSLDAANEAQFRQWGEQR